MPADNIPDDIAALLRDDATDANGAHTRQRAKTMRGTVPGTSRPAALAGFAAGILCGIVLCGIAGALVVVPLLAPPPIAQVPVPVPAVESPQTLAEVAPTPVARAVPARTLVAKSARVAPRVIPPATERATERPWLDAARTALTQDDLEGAATHLETARAKFPDGSLSEEREALAIHVLIARGDQTLAAQAIDTFRARHPGSPFALAIEDAMQEMEGTR